jgi:hypothetical protein
MAISLASLTFVYASKNSSDEPSLYSKERLYQDIMFNLLYTNIEDEVDKYYLQYMTISPSVYPYQIQVLYVERISGGYRFKLKLRVNPVYGPHLRVGTDDITFLIGSTGRVTVDKFEHIKSYKLPQRYERFIKEGFTNPIP